MFCTVEDATTNNPLCRIKIIQFQEYVWGVLAYTSSNNMFGIVQSNVESDGLRKSKR
jgi:hypothetical protein